MIKHLLFILSLLSVPAMAWPGDTILVSGVFPGAGGQEIRLMAPKDMFSPQSREIVSAIADEDGHFSFSFTADRTRQYALRVMQFSNTLYAGPGNDLKLSFDTIDLASSSWNPYPLLQPYPMKVRNRNQGQPDLNELSHELHLMVADFLEAEVAQNVRANHRPALHAFSSRLDSAYRDVDHPFFQAYIRYFMAYLHSSLHATPVGELIQLYLLDQPVLYDHPLYADFFKSVMDNYIFSGSRSLRLRELQNLVNGEADYHGLMEYLERDPLLADDRMRELVMTRSLQNMLNRRGFDPGQVLKVLQQTAASGRHAEHRQMAGRILDHQLSLRPGSRAPSFSLADAAGGELVLDDFLGQYVYLFFGSMACPVSMGEIGALMDLAEGLGDQLMVVGILTDHDPEGIGELHGRNADNAVFLHFGGDYRLLDRYRLRTIPYFVLIGPQGEIIGKPFLAPTAGAEAAIKEVISGSG